MHRQNTKQTSPVLLLACSDGFTLYNSLLKFVFVCSNTIQHIRDTQATECQVDDGDS